MNREKFLYKLKNPEPHLSEFQKNEIIDMSICACDWTTKSMVIMEELAELSQAVSKGCRYGVKEENKIDILEEMADVLMCMEFLKKHYNLSDNDIRTAMDIKLRRERDRRCVITEDQQ